ncbi:ParD-like family protein [Aquabacterium sp. A7-Y]|uniref:TA system antitoxin ParD family protein n=1 Tax=Aquabacterium sp. A7-Y TaxID=1349605 RepID=UPI00223D4192|nr:hypothetical protein [Aquabacterium sp. A7-Y]MCW7538244.1 ParD-like family protein [Aquabacterium sp. A7-Y]
MAQSIRVSDDLYDLAQTVSAALGRSLAQQIEYWARLGAALDAAGLTSDQATKILNGDVDLKAQVRALLGSSHAERYEGLGSPVVAARRSGLLRDVVEGRRTAQSLFVIPDELVRSAKLTFPSPPESDGAGW